MAPGALERSWRMGVEGFFEFSPFCQVHGVLLGAELLTQMNPTQLWPLELGRNLWLQPGPQGSVEGRDATGGEELWSWSPGRVAGQPSVHLLRMSFPTSSWLSVADLQELFVLTSSFLLSGLV